jgi:hypothetical protein
LRLHLAVAEDLDDLIRTLRASGGDTTSVEVKAAGGGLPVSPTASLSALANLPGGGTIILGLDERAGFRPVPLADPQILEQGLTAKARAYTPPVSLSIVDGLVDGQPVVVAHVHECDPSVKPCRVTATGTAYLRGYDGDFPLSDLETQGFLAARRPPLFDRQPVDGASLDDLDPELVTSYLATVRQRDATGLGRFDDDAELLRRAGVTATGGQPTVAGLLALGVHPQQFFPRYVIRAAAEPLPQDPPAVRARNQITITGPIPRMLDAALDWARRTFDTTIVANPDGSVADHPRTRCSRSAKSSPTHSSIATSTTGRKPSPSRYGYAATDSLSPIPAGFTASPSTASATTPSPRPETGSLWPSASTSAPLAPAAGASKPSPAASPPSPRTNDPRPAPSAIHRHQHQVHRAAPHPGRQGPLKPAPQHHRTAHPRHAHARPEDSRRTRNRTRPHQTKHP